MGEASSKELGFGNCLIPRVSINDKDFEVAKSLRGEVFQQVGEIFDLVQSWNNDGEKGLDH